MEWAGGEAKGIKQQNKSCKIHILWVIIISKQYIKLKMYNCLSLIKKFLQTYVLNKIKINYLQHNFETGNSKN